MKSLEQVSVMECYERDHDLRETETANQSEILYI